MNNLTTLIKRLEAVTSRLEDIAASAQLPKDALLTLGLHESPLLRVAATTAASQTTKAIVAKALPLSVERFDAFLSSNVKKYSELSDQIGGLVAEQAAKVVEGLQEQRKLLLISADAKKPDMDEWQTLLKSMNSAATAVVQLQDDNFGHALFNHLSAVADGIMMFGWVNVEMRPYRHVDKSLESAQFFGNKVLREYKGKDPKHVDWILSFYGLLEELSNLLEHHFASGIVWNSKGRPALEVRNSISTSDGAPPAIAATTSETGVSPFSPAGIDNSDASNQT